MGGVTTYYPNQYYEVAGGVVKKYYYAGAQRVAMKDSGATRALLGDHLGSTAVTVAGTSELGEVRYRAFGASRFTSGTTPTTFRYTGQREESALGLYYYGARWYDPALGHFVQPDTIVPNPADALDYQRYGYARFNPLKYNDPTGHQASCMVDQDGNWDCGPTNVDTVGYDPTNPLPDCEPSPCDPWAVGKVLGGMLVGSYTVMAGIAVTPQIIASVAGTGAKQACADGDCTNEVQSAVGNSSKIVDFAQSLQGSGNYPGVDQYTETVLRRGTVIYGGAPGQSNFYTTGEAVKAAGGSAQRFFQGLQVAPHPQIGYRPGVTAYEVLEDVPAAIGKALANSQHGSGGSTQIVIESFQQVLKPLYSIPFAK